MPPTTFPAACTHATFIAAACTVLERTEHDARAATRGAFKRGRKRSIPGPVIAFRLSGPRPRICGAAPSFLGAAELGWVGRGGTASLASGGAGEAPPWRPARGDGGKVRLATGR